MKNDIDHDRALKRWLFMAVCWPLSCLIFAGIIICQPGRGGEERIADVGFTLFPLIFFAIGMTMQHRLLQERRDATVLTIATVVSVRRTLHIGEGNKRTYFPEYEFQVDGIIYHVKSPSGFSRSYVKEGERVELYYSPANPTVFYVPVMQKHDKRWSVLLRAIGITYPLIGLFAPLARTIFSSL